MITGRTESGFEFHINEEIGDDYEFLEMLSKIDSGDMFLVIKMVDTLLGEEQKNALKDHIREENGRVTISKMFNTVIEILKSSKQGKNS